MTCSMEWAGQPGGAGPAAGAAPRGSAGRSGWIKRPRRTLSALALGLCALGVAVGSGADFSAQTANPSNTFSAGSLSMDNSKDGSAIFSATGMKPGGDPETGVVDIENTGSIDGVFTLRRDLLMNSDVGVSSAEPFASKVNVRIVDCGEFTTAGGPYGPETVTPICGDGDDEPLYAGTLGGQDNDVGLGVYQPGEQHRYQFGGSLDASAGADYAGDGASARYVFDAVQTP